MGKQKNPFLFIPGLMGSYGGEMSGSNRGWGFGAARVVYDPVIRGLERLGYRKNQNLFICYFDWRKGLEEIVAEYLVPLLLQIRQKFPDEPLDVMAHSMGGLVIRTYVQQHAYFGKIDKLILVGTPNQGAVDAYYYWSTGEMPSKNKRSFFHILYRGYIWLLRRKLGLPGGPDYLTQLHQAFPSMGQIIPGKGFGPFLAYELPSGEQVPIPQERALYQNRVLDRLNQHVRLLKQRTGSLTYYAGEGFETLQGILVDRDAFYQSREKLVGLLQNPSGDGTVATHSAILKRGTGKILHRNHHQLLSDAVRDLGGQYGVKEAAVEPRPDSVLHLIFPEESVFTLMRGLEPVLRYEGGYIQGNCQVMLETAPDRYRWMLLTDLLEGEYHLLAEAGVERELQMLVLSHQLELEIDRTEPVQGQHSATFYYTRTENYIE